MDEYSVYWIKDRIGVNYFHKSGVLYRFINQYRSSPGRMDLQLQYDYITKDFQKEQLIFHFKQYQSSKLAIEVRDDKIYLRRNERMITLQINHNYLQFRCSTLNDAEDLLFPILRNFHSSLFVAGNNIRNYGWIAPLKNIENDYAKELLYSIPSVSK